MCDLANVFTSTFNIQSCTSSRCVNKLPRAETCTNFLTILYCSYCNDGHDREEHGRQLGTNVEHESNGDDHLEGVACQHRDVYGDRILDHLCVRAKPIGQFTRPRGVEECVLRDGSGGFECRLCLVPRPCPTGLGTRLM